LFYTFVDGCRTHYWQIVVGMLDTPHLKLFSSLNAGDSCVNCRQPARGWEII